MPGRIAEIEAALAEVPAAQGYLVVATELGERSYLLGPRTDVSATPPMLDWRTAPLAEAFFRAAPGEPYAIESGERIFKYGAPIGVATRDIEPGEYVHTHNMTSDYLPTFTLEEGHQFVKEVK